MQTIQLILCGLAITAFAAAPAEARSSKNRKPVQHQQVMPHSDIGNPAYRAGDPDVVYSNRNPFRVLGKSSDPRIRSRMREDDDAGYGPWP